MGVIRVFEWALEIGQIQGKVKSPEAILRRPGEKRKKSLRKEIFRVILGIFISNREF